MQFHWRSHWIYQMENIHLTDSRMINRPLYINSNSNNLPTIINCLHASINKRLNKISSSKVMFEAAKVMFHQALKSSYQYQLFYENPKPRTGKKRNRKRNIILFNQLFSKSVGSNVSRIFLELIDSTCQPTTNSMKYFIEIPSEKATIDTMFIISKVEKIWQNLELDLAHLITIDLDTALIA